MAQKTKAQILAEIASLLADNTTGDISASDVRTVVNDITDSYEDLIATGTTSQYLRGDKTWQTLPILEASGTLSAAQINALYDTPLQILPVLGTNKYYVINNSSLHYKSNGTGYAGDFTALFLGYSPSEFICNIIDSTKMQTTNKVVNKYPSYSEDNDVANFIINKGISIFADEVPTTGNGTINYSISYRIVTTS
jgi:hypothetical protein